MSWASDRLRFLNKYFDETTIVENTGIPIDTISFVVQDQVKLPPEYIRNLANYYGRTAYTLARAAGATTTVARFYRSRSVARLEAFLGESNTLINELANMRFEQYKRYLISQGRYTNDEDVLRTLKESIARSMGKTTGAGDRDFSRDSPSLRHEVVIDEEQ